jgi:2,3-dihydroxybenzoate-AMP ligase
MWDGGADAIGPDGFFCTGDLVDILDDGRLVVRGRAKRMISRGGVKISPEEVEIVLAGHPAVREAVMVGVTDGRRGERAIAIVAPRDRDRPPAFDELRRHLEARGIGKLRQPDELLLLDGFPKNTVGKTDWRAAATWAAGQVQGRKGSCE